MLPRYYLRFLGGASKVRTLVGITPINHGTTLAGLGTLLGANPATSSLIASECPACLDDLAGSSFMRQLNAGGDTVNTIKQAAEFKLTDKQKLVALIFDLQSVPALGLTTAQGLTGINAMYWDMNDQTRAWSNRYQQRHPKKMMPNHMQAGVYAGTLHYLKAVEKVGSPADGRAVVAAMKASPTEDPVFGKGYIRADGRKMHPMYLLQVKTPAESKGEYDWTKVIATLPGDKVFRPIDAPDGCPAFAKK